MIADRTVTLLPKTAKPPAQTSGFIILGLLFCLWFAPLAARAAAGNFAQFNRWSHSSINAASSDALNPSAALTLEAWIRPEAGCGEWALVMGKKYNLEDSNPWYSYRLCASYFSSFPGKISFQIAPDTLGGETGATSSSDIPLNTWTHVAGTYDGATLKIYINGELENSTPVTGNIRSSSLPVYIGKAPWTNYNNFNGQMDELRIWNVARTQDEIRHAMRRSLLGSETGLVAYWPFNDAAGSDTTEDMSSYNHTGTLYNGSAITAGSTVPHSLVSWWRAEDNADDSGGANHGAMQNGAAFAAAGRFGKGFSFDGVDDTIRIPASASLQATSFTAAAWINPATTGADMPVLEWNNETGADPSFGPHLWLKVDGSLVANPTAAGETVVQTAPGLVPANAWSHAAFAYDAATGTVTIYLNGEQVASRQFAPPELHTEFPLFIGRRPSSHNGPQELLSFNGLIDEVEIHSRALTEEEILLIYQQADITPAAFPFTPQTRMPLDTAVISNPATISGINVASPVSISGGEYRLNGGAWTAAGSQAVSGDQVEVRLTSAATHETAATATLTVGGVDSVFSVTTAAADDPQASGLAAWWRAENNAYDSLGRHHGTVHGEVAYADSREGGRAFSCNGSTARVIAGGDATLPVGDAARTLSFWMKTSNAGQDGKSPVIYGDQDTEGAFYVSIFGGKACIGRWGGGDQASTATVTDGKWHHVALTYENDAARLYVDGGKVLDVARSFNTSISGAACRIGGSISPAIYYDGLVDEVCIFNRALTEAEVAIQAGPLPLAGLRCWLKPDAGVTNDGAGKVSRWADSSGNGFDLVQNTAAKQPLLVQDAAGAGRPALRFDGSDDYLQTAAAVNLLAGTRNFSTFIVTKPGASQKQYADIIDYQHEGSVNFVIQQNGNNTNQFGFIHWQQLSGAAFQVHADVYVDNASYTSYVNSATRLQTTSFPALNWAEPRVFTVGSKSLEAFARQFNGDVCEVIVYNTALSDTDRQAVENHLLSKYGIPAPATIAWEPPEAVTYGTALGNAQLNATANTAGVFTYTPPAGTVLNAGTGQELRVDFVPDDTAKWTAVSKTVTIDVARKTLVCTAVSQTRLYGDPNPAFTAVCSGFVNGDDAADLTAPPAAVCAADAASRAGDYQIVPSGGVAANYDFTYQNGTLTVLAGGRFRLWATPAAGEELPLQFGMAATATNDFDPEWDAIAATEAAAWLANPRVADPEKQLLAKDFLHAADFGRWRLELAADGGRGAVVLNWDVASAAPGHAMYLQEIQDERPAGPPTDMLTTDTLETVAGAAFEIVCGEPREQEISLRRGWNSIGTPFIGTAALEALAAAPAAAGVTLPAWFWNGTAYEAAASAEPLPPESAHFVHCKAKSATIVLNGLPADGLLRLQPGWNFVSPPADAPMPDQTGIAAPAWTWRPLPGAYFGVPAGGTLKAGSGYWIFVSSETAVTIKLGE